MDAQSLTIYGLGWVIFLADCYHVFLFHFYVNHDKAFPGFIVWLV